MVSYAEVKSYLSKREIPQLFESLMAGLMYHRPENHISYLQTCLDEIKAAGDPSNLQWSMFVSGKKRKSKELPPLTPKKQETVVWTDNSRQSTPLPPISAKSRCLHTRHGDSHHNTLRSTYILYHNPPPVLAPPTVPVIFVLGGLGPKIDTLCEQVVARLRGIVHISTCSMIRTRMTIEGFYRTTSVPACAVVDSVLQAMSMVQSAKSLLIAGFPRNRGDIEEYRSRQVRMDGVVLVDFEEEALRSFLHDEVKSGMIKMADVETELESYKQDLISVAEYYDDKDLLTVVMGDQDSEDVVNDMVIAVDKIVETRSKLSVEESLAADFRAQRCRSNVSCRAIEASPTTETDRDNSETSNVAADQPVVSDASSESGTGTLKETNLCLILIFCKSDIAAESVATLTSGDYAMRYIEFNDLIKQAQCSDKSECQTKQGLDDSTMGTDRALYLLKREMLKYLSSARVFVISGFPRTVEEAKRFEKEIGLCDAAIDLTDLGDTQQPQETTADVLNYFDGKVKRISDIGLSVGVQISRIIQIILSEKKSSVVEVMSAENIVTISDRSEDIKTEIKEDKSESPIESIEAGADESKVNTDSDKHKDVSEAGPQDVNIDASNEASVRSKSGETEAGEVTPPQEEVKDTLSEKSVGSQEKNQKIAEERSASKVEIMESGNGIAEEKVPELSASEEKNDETTAASEKEESIASHEEEKSEVLQALVSKKPVLVRQETFSAATLSSEKESNAEELKNEEGASDKDSQPENNEVEPESEKAKESKHESDINHEVSEKENSLEKSVSERGDVPPSSAGADGQKTPVSNAEDSVKGEEIDKSEQQMLEAVEEQIIKTEAAEVQGEFKGPVCEDTVGDKLCDSANSGNPEDGVEKGEPSQKSGTDEAGENQECVDEKTAGEGDVGSADENVNNTQDEKNIESKHSANGSNHSKEQEENPASPEKQISEEVRDEAPAAAKSVPKDEAPFDEIKGSDTEDIEISDLTSDQQPLMEYDSAEETDNVNTEGIQNVAGTEDDGKPNEDEDKKEATEIEETHEDDDKTEYLADGDNASNVAEQPEPSEKDVSGNDNADSKGKEEDNGPVSENTAQDGENSVKVEESQHSVAAENIGEENIPDPENSNDVVKEEESDQDEKTVTGAEDENQDEKTVIDAEDENQDEKTGADAEDKTESQSDGKEKNESNPDGENEAPSEENQPEKNANEQDGDDPGSSNLADENDQPSAAEDPSAEHDGDENLEQKSDENEGNDSAEKENENEDAQDDPSEKDIESAQQQNDTAENEETNPESTTGQNPDNENDKEQDGEVSKGDDTKEDEENDTNKSGNSDQDNANSAKGTSGNSEAADDDEKEETSPTDDDKKEETSPTDDDKKEETSPTDDDKKEETSPTDDDKKEGTSLKEEEKKEETECDPTDDDPKERTESSPTNDDTKEETETSPAGDDQKKESGNDEQSESQEKKEDPPAEATAEESHSENSTLYLKSASVTDRYIRSGTSEHSDVRRNGNDLVTDGMDIASEQRDEEQQERSTSSSRGEL